jgi:hypothetical protein
MIYVLFGVKLSYFIKAMEYYELFAIFNDSWRIVNMLFR